MASAAQATPTREGRTRNKGTKGGDLQNVNPPQKTRIPTSQERGHATTPVQTGAAPTLGRLIKAMGRAGWCMFLDSTRRDCWGCTRGGWAPILIDDRAQRSTEEHDFASE